MYLSQNKFNVHVNVYHKPFFSKTSWDSDNSIEYTYLKTNKYKQGLSGQAVQFTEIFLV